MGFLCSILSAKVKGINYNLGLLQLTTVTWSVGKKSYFAHKYVGADDITDRLHPIWLQVLSFGLYHSSTACAMYVIQDFMYYMGLMVNSKPKTDFMHFRNPV